jgi:hypothetical protein
MILFTFLNYLRLMILMVIWLDLLKLLATTMKEEVIRALIMLLILISCKVFLLIYIGRLLFIVIHSYTKCLCVEKKLDFVDITFVFCFSLYQVLTSHYYDWFESTMGPCYYPWNTSQGRGTHRSISSLVSFTQFNYQVSKTSYMAIKKAFYGRRSGCFCFDFLCVSFCNKRLYFCFATGVFNKVPNFTHFGLLKLPKSYRAEIPT